jgi:hypothetical protein
MENRTSFLDDLPPVSYDDFFKDDSDVFKDDNFHSEEQMFHSESVEYLDEITDEDTLQNGKLFKEPCKKCNNGTFISYSGRALGKCYVCHGRGFFERKTSPETRLAAKVARDTKKSNEKKENIESFQKFYPTQWEWLNKNLSFSFAASLMGNLVKYGSLTENQISAIDRCIDRNNQRKTEVIQKIENAPKVSVDKLMECFNKARSNGLKKPILRFEIFQAALDRRDSNLVWLNNGFDNRLGRIQNGKFVAGRDCSPAQAVAIEAALNDPLAAAVAYGKRIGACSCCGLTLTNPISIERGIGPICAEKFGF